MLDEFAGMPTEYELMVECVVTLNDSEASAADQLEALEALAMLVEPIDNANGEQQVLTAYFRQLCSLVSC